MAHCAAITERPLPDSAKRAHHQKALSARGENDKGVEAERPEATSRAAGAVGGGDTRGRARAVDRRMGVAAQWSAAAGPRRWGAAHHRPPLGWSGEAGRQEILQLRVEASAARATQSRIASAHVRRIECMAEVPSLAVVYVYNCTPT